MVCGWLRRGVKMQDCSTSHEHSKNASIWTMSCDRPAPPPPAIASRWSAYKMHTGTWATHLYLVVAHEGQVVDLIKDQAHTARTAARPALTCNSTRLTLGPSQSRPPLPLPLPRRCRNHLKLHHLPAHRALHHLLSFFRFLDLGRGISSFASTVPATPSAGPMPTPMS